MSTVDIEVLYAVASVTVLLHPMRTTASKALQQLTDYGIDSESFVP
jgi:hypothetical protein